MSLRRFCAVDDELWDKVPSRAPNSLCPRLRSSNWLMLLRPEPGFSLLSSSGVDLASLPLLLSSWDRRGRLGWFSEVEDCLRLIAVGDGMGLSVVSGTITADASGLRNNSALLYLEKSLLLRWGVGHALVVLVAFQAKDDSISDDI